MCWVGVGFGVECLDWLVGDGGLGSGGYEGLGFGSGGVVVSWVEKE